MPEKLRFAGPISMWFFSSFPSTKKPGLQNAGPAKIRDQRGLKGGSSPKSAIEDNRCHSNELRLGAKWLAAPDDQDRTGAWRAKAPECLRFADSADSHGGTRSPTLTVWGRRVRIL